MLNSRKFLTSTTKSLNRIQYSIKNKSDFKYFASPTSYKKPEKLKRDVIIIGGGHNALVTAFYLRKAGLDVLVLERRHVIGGAAVTEELLPGYKFSRASYLAGLLRPHIIKEMGLEKHGFHYISRDPSSFTPTAPSRPNSYNNENNVYDNYGKYLLLGSNDEDNYKSLASFSENDAKRYNEYEDMLNKVRDIVQPLLDQPPLNPLEGNLSQKIETLKKIFELGKICLKNREALINFYELITGPADAILNRYFESDILKATLATDSIIGAMTSPRLSGSAYVLLHHVMGEANGKKGVWAYIKGGMGAITQSMSEANKEIGTEIITNANVRRILYKQEEDDDKQKKKGFFNLFSSDNKKEKKSDEDKKKAIGVQLEDGLEIYADTIISGASPYHTFTSLLDKPLDKESDWSKFQTHIEKSDYSCGSFKINMAVKNLPKFSCYHTKEEIESNEPVAPAPIHHGTIHFETSTDTIHQAYLEASNGIIPARPVIEMTIPSVLDRSLVPEGSNHHIVQLFVQFVPYEIKNANKLSYMSTDPINDIIHINTSNKKASESWNNPIIKEQFIKKILSIIEIYAPNFSANNNILHIDALSPIDLERIFNLPFGNIFHSSLSPHQLAYLRPVPGFSNYRTPINNLYLCSAGTHPGGGVMGAAGRNAAREVLRDRGIKWTWY